MLEINGAEDGVEEVDFLLPCTVQQLTASKCFCLLLLHEVFTLRWQFKYAA